jgi:hypothetical protein
MATRTTRIAIRVSPDQKGLIAARARDAGLSVCTYIRLAALLCGTHTASTDTSSKPVTAAAL